MTGNDLKALRISRKLQVQELAGMLGVSRMTLYRHEQEDVDVPLLIELAVLHLLGSRVIDFVTVTRVGRVRKVSTGPVKPTHKLLRR